MPKDTAPNPEELVTRETAALRLGFSTHELRRREKLGQIKAVRRGTKGSYLYSLEDVKRLELQLAKQRDSYTIDEAKTVFKLLSEGKTLVQCVFEGNVQPSVVDVLATQYAMLSKSIFVPDNVLKQINALPYDGPLPVETAEDILALIVELGGGKCLECAKRPRAFCGPCVKDAMRKAKSGTDEVD